MKKKEEKKKAKKKKWGKWLVVSSQAPVYFILPKKKKKKKKKLKNFLYLFVYSSLLVLKTNLKQQFKFLNCFALLHVLLILLA
jgi:hypothetical protein